MTGMVDDFKNALGKAKNILINPFRTFAEIADNETRENEALIYTAVVFIFATIISYGMNLLIPNSGFITVQWQNVQPGPLGLLIGHVIFYFLWLLFTYIGAGLWFLLLYVPSKVVKVDFSFGKIYQVLVYSITPAYIFGKFPYVGNIGALWTLCLLVISYKEIFKTTYLRSLIALLSPFVVILLLVFLFGSNGTVQVRF